MLKRKTKQKKYESKLVKIHAAKANQNIKSNYNVTCVQQKRCDYYDVTTIFLKLKNSLLKKKSVPSDSNPGTLSYRAYSLIPDLSVPKTQKNEFNIN